MTLADVERKAVKEAGLGICVDAAEQDQGPRVPPQEEACAWGWGGGLKGRHNSVCPVPVPQEGRGLDDTMWQAFHCFGIMSSLPMGKSWRLSGLELNLCHIPNKPGHSPTPVQSCQGIIENTRLELKAHCRTGPICKVGKFLCCEFEGMD